MTDAAFYRSIANLAKGWRPGDASGMDAQQVITILCELNEMLLTERENDPPLSWQDIGKELGVNVPPGAVIPDFLRERLSENAGRKLRYAPAGRDSARENLKSQGDVYMIWVNEGDLRTLQVDGVAIEVAP